MYAYVGGNPMSYNDPSGLTQADLDAAIAYIRQSNPALIASNPAFINKVLDDAYGETENKSTVFINMAALDADTTAGTNRIARYVQTVAHELMHVQDLTNLPRGIGYLYTIFPTRHDQIFNESYRIRRNYENGVTCPLK